MKHLLMGQRVIVNAVAHPRYVDNNRKWIVEIIHERVGWYVGYTYKQEGKVRIDDFNYLEVSRRIKLARVKFSENSNDSFVFEENIKSL